MRRFNSRRRLRSAVLDAFAARLHYYHYQSGGGVMPVELASDSTGPIGQVLDSLDEIDLLKQDKQPSESLDDVSLHKWLELYDNISSLNLSQKSIPDPVGENVLIDNLQFLHCLQPSEVTSELQSILSNEHLRQLMIAHDLISGQIYQQPALRLYPSGALGAASANSGQFSKSSSGCTTASSGSNEIAAINQMQPSEYQQDDNMRKVRFDKRADEPLGITLRMENGKCLVARVIVGGMIHRQKLLNVGDEIFEINNISVRHKDIAELQMMLRQLRGTITFTLSPSNKAMSPACEIYVRALFDFDPMQSQDCPCKEAGLRFKVGEVLMISCKDDDFWWQAKNMDTELTGLIPSPQFREWKANSQLIVDKMKSKNILFGSGGASLTPTRGGFGAPQAPPVPPPTLCYEEVKRVDNFRRKTLVLIGAHGVGRRNIKNMLIQRNEENATQYAYPVPHTTRPIRPGEVHGKEYYFIDFGEMNAAIQKGEFLEYGEHDGHIYGTRLSTIKEINKAGTVSILDVEPNSLRVLRNKTYAPLVVYIAPGKGSNHNGYDGNPMLLDDSKAIMSAYAHHFDVIIPNNDTGETVNKIAELFNQLLARAQWVPSTWL